MARASAAPGWHWHSFAWLAGTPAAQLVLACAGIGLPFLTVLVAPLPVWAGQPARAPSGADVPLEPIGWAGVPVTIGFVLILCLPYRPYSLALRAASAVTGRVSSRATGLASSRLVWLLTLALATIGVLIYPRFGSDVFDYAGFERMWVVYGDNPLLSLVANRPADWGAPFVWYPDRTPAYGPLWAILTWPIVRLAGESPAAEVAGYKLLATLAYAACCWLIWTSVEPHRRQRALILFAWSPLVLFEVLGKVHNDILPAVGLLGMFWLLSRKRESASMLAMVAGGLVKGMSLAAAPPLAMRLWRLRGWRALLPAVLGALVLVAASYAPFWVGPRTVVPILQQTGRLGWSPFTLLLAAFDGLGQPPPEAVIRVLLGLVWAGACGVVLWRGRTDRPAYLATSSGWLVLATIILLTSAIFGHYFVVAVALAAVADDPRLEQAVAWLSIGGLAAYGVGGLGWALGPAWIGSLSYQVAGSLVLLLPACIALLLSASVARSTQPRIASD